MANDKVHDSGERERKVLRFNVFSLTSAIQNFVTTDGHRFAQIRIKIKKLSSVFINNFN
jgi:hypothetical protein